MYNENEIKLPKKNYKNQKKGQKTEEEKNKKRSLHFAQDLTCKI